jgi:hypothetical protein
MRHRTDVTVETKWDGILLPNSLRSLNVRHKLNYVCTLTCNLCALLGKHNTVQCLISASEL